jgi:Family of unknown function (DUF6335)
MKFPRQERGAGKANMVEQEKNSYINNRRDQGDEQAIDEEVKESFAEDQQLDQGGEELMRKPGQHTDESPKLAAGDVDAAWEDADEEGEETVGGMTPTPDQDIVDEVGDAVGLTYSDTEPLHTDDKLSQRERNRWELDPASDPEYAERVKEEFKKPPKPKGKRRPKSGKKAG